MFLFKRHGVFYLEYLDKQEYRLRRISTKTKRQREALVFLTEFKEKLSEQPTTKSISIADFREEYVAFLRNGHPFASNLVKRSVPTVTVKELLGHSDISTTMICGNVRREDSVNAVKMLEGHRAYHLVRCLFLTSS